jgi:hypothetical protein
MFLHFVLLSTVVKNLHCTNCLFKTYDSVTLGNGVCVHFAGRIFLDFFPGTTTPCGEPGHRSGITGDVIHFNATQAVRMGYQYWDAYQSAMALTAVAPSAKTKACNASSSIALPEQVIAKCGTMHSPEY